MRGRLCLRRVCAAGKAARCSWSHLLHHGRQAASVTHARDKVDARRTHRAGQHSPRHAAAHAPRRLQRCIRHGRRGHPLAAPGAGSAAAPTPAAHAPNRHAPLAAGLAPGALHSLQAAGGGGGGPVSMRAGPAGTPPAADSTTAMAWKQRRTQRCTPGWLGAQPPSREDPAPRCRPPLLLLPSLLRPPTLPPSHPQSPPTRPNMLTPLVAKMACTAASWCW